MKHLLVALCLMVASSIFAQIAQLDNLGLSLIPSPKECIVKSAKLNKLKDCRTVKHATPLGADEYGLSIRRGKATMWGNEAWARQTLRQLTDANGCFVADIAGTSAKAGEPITRAFVAGELTFVVKGVEVQ